MKSTLIVVDTRNIRHNLSKNFDRDRLDFTKYIAAAIGEDILFGAQAYGSPASADTSQKFIKMLRLQGFDIHFSDPITKPGLTDADKPEVFHIDASVAIAVNVLELCSSGKIDRVVIGSSNPQLAPLITALRRKGLIVDVFAARVTRALHNVASSVQEIGEELLLN